VLDGEEPSLNALHLFVEDGDGGVGVLADAPQDAGDGAVTGLEGAAGYLHHDASPPGGAPAAHEFAEGTMDGWVQVFVAGDDVAECEVVPEEVLAGVADLGGGHLGRTAAGGVHVEQGGAAGVGGVD